jgi:hypothetical protein
MAHECLIRNVVVAGCDSVKSSKPCFCRLEEVLAKASQDLRIMGSDSKKKLQSETSTESGSGNNSLKMS